MSFRKPLELRIIMSSAHGSLFCKNSKLAATFLIDGHVYMYNGDVHVAVPDFEAVAVITYSAKSELSGHQSSVGMLLTHTVDIQLVNGPKISGTLTAPMVPAMRFTADGIWSVAEDGSS
ncbi:hypothetical protein BDW22DRAFT_1430710 [Trametopsis cervina]|nr:hypothetical protein BDW22DRAFT_1430710 [Trametopsis cervina]